MLKYPLLCSALVGVAFAAYADTTGPEFGTSNEAKAMLIRAVAAVKADRTGAIDKFNHNTPQFRDRDLFVFCFNGQDGKFIAHEALIAWDVRTLRDPTGKAFGAEMHANAQDDRITEIMFVAPWPGSTGLAPKRAYMTRLGDLVCGVSAYEFNRKGSATQR